VDIQDDQKVQASFIMRVAGDAKLEESSPKKYTKVHLIDREMEIQCANAAFQSGTSPRVREYNSKEGLMLTEFLNGTILTEENIRQPQMLKQVLKLLIDFQTNVVLKPASYGVFTPMRLAENYLIHARQFGSNLPSYIDDVFTKVREIDKLLSKSKTPTSSIHNDLVPANIIKDDKRLWLFDFEYCNVGDPYNDLANIAAMNMFSESEEELLFQLYHEIKGIDLSTDPELKNFLFAQHNLMKILSNLKEGMWGMVQGYVTDIEFETSWSSHSSFEEYGLEFLSTVQKNLLSSQFSTWMQTVENYFNKY